MTRRSTETDFWARVDKNGRETPLGRCWMWTGYVSRGGYGILSYQGETWNGHRLAWTLVHGTIPEGRDVLHNCDEFYPTGDITNRRCVNPDHTYLGTDIDNVHDMMRRGRFVPPPGLNGEGLPQAKLTEEQVRAIRATETERIADVAARYDVSRSTISLIRRRAIWKHVV